MAASADTTNKGPSLTTMIVVGLVAGLLVGLFCGEYTRGLKWIGDAFVGLLQMAVLPYVATSLITNVGRLSVADGIRLLRLAVVVMLLLWLIGMIALGVMTQAFPYWPAGSFFGSRFTEEPPSPNWLDLFIPSNPFRSFADNSIPAVVVFCLGIGAALMFRPNKEKLLEPLEVLVDTLADLNKLVVKLTPIGMFAIVAYTAGTIDPEEFQLIQGYLLTYGASAILLSFVVFPLVVSTYTRLTYRDVVNAARDPLVAAFVIGNSFVVLPLIIDAIKSLERKYELPEEQDSRRPEYLVPLAYPFPDIGRIVGLIFIPFAAWFYGRLVESEMILPLLGVGFLGSFGKPVITIPLLLNIAELPNDIFNLYLASGVVAARFGDLMKTMHLMTFTILTIAALNGGIRFRPSRIVAGTVGSILLLCLAAFGIRTYLDAQFKDKYSKESLVTHRDLQFPEGSRLSSIVPEVLETSEPNPDPIQSGQSRIQRIQQRGKIRIGYDEGKMPFAYFRFSSRVLIGFDIQMAYVLANDLDVGIEFVPIDRDRLYQQLRDDHFDVAMSAIEGNVKQAAMQPAIDSYMDVTLAIVVPDYEKRNFRSVDQILDMPNVKLAAVKGGYFTDHAPKVLPENVEIVELDSVAEYFQGKYREVSGLVISAESGSAWTLRYPQFTVANPLQGRTRVPLYYITDRDLEFERFLQNWLTLKRSNGTYDELYDYWILGLDNKSRKPRWCIMRDVLGWAK